MQNPYHHQQQQYDGQQQSQHDGYSYPPSSGANNSEKAGYFNNAYELSREQSLGGETVTGSSMMHSPYDEKLAAAAAASASASTDGLPAAIPRYPNGRPDAAHGAHGSKSSVSFVPGHLSRGSVALLAAAEGNIPKKEGLKLWRKDEHAGVFTAGGRRRTCMRCCCCTIIFALILVIGIVAAFLLWVRPPNVQFQGVLAPQDGTQQLVISGSSFNLNFDLDIAVSNPNFFGASFQSIRARAFYPINDKQQVGGGQMLNVNIPAHSHNKLLFPFAINYTSAIDPGSKILLDIATKCGFVGDAAPQDIKVNYQLTLAVKIVLFTISPTFSSSTSFGCPLTEQDIQGLVGGSGLSGLLGGGSGGS